MGLIAGAPRLLDRLAPSDRQALFELGTRRVLPAGTHLMRETDDSQFIVLLVDGWVVAWTSMHRGGRLILAIRGPGDIVGDLSAMDGQPRSATVTALGSVDAVVIPGLHFQTYLSQHAKAAALYMGDLSGRLREADSERRSLASASVLQRLAGRLAELAERHGRRSPDGIVLVPALTQHDLGSSIGATREAVAKSMRVLRERDVVRTGQREIVIIRPELLVALAEPLDDDNR